MVGRCSKRSSSSFVSEHPHAAETIGLPETGISGRDVPEGPSTLKRKRAALNVKSCQGFSIPFEVVPVSRLSARERRNLVKRLEVELEQIKSFYGTLICRDYSGDGPPLPVDAQLKNMTVCQPAPLLKRSASARPRRPVSSARKMNPFSKNQCEALLRRLMSHRYGWVFNTPVDVVKLRIPDYFDIIKHPMDLGTVKEKLAEGAYASPFEFVSDVRLTFTNAITYNLPGTDVHSKACCLNGYLEKQWKCVEEKISRKELGVVREKKSEQRSPKLTKIKTPPANLIDVAPANVKVQEEKMAADLRNRLYIQLQGLPSFPEQIDCFFRRNISDESDEVIVDLDLLNYESLVELQKLLDDHLSKERIEIGMTTKPEEVKETNDPGPISSSCVHPRKACKTVCPPLETESDTNTTNSSSSGSSSSSDSSSSDSDSESESDVATTSIPAIIVKGTAKSLATLDQETTDIISVDGNWQKESSQRPEVKVHLKAESGLEVRHQEGKNAPSKRNASPGKLHRATTLRNQSAETILSDQKKILNKDVHKADKDVPERLQEEGNQLERQHRKEKVQLQAEAEVADDAHKQAEAAATEEAKWKLEFQREAARQALLKVQKTVEINDNCHIMKDFEMLTSNATDHFRSIGRVK